MHYHEPYIEQTHYKTDTGLNKGGMTTHTSASTTPGEGAIGRPHKNPTKGTTNGQAQTKVCDAETHFSKGHRRGGKPTKTKVLITAQSQLTTGLTL